MMNRKVPAFTLMEVTIAMLIAGIAIAITFTAYRIVSGTYFNFNQKQGHLATYISLDKLLKHDFMKATTALKTDEGVAFEVDGRVIRYDFKTDYILRDQFSLRTDTFKMKAQDVVLLFEQLPAEQGKPVDAFGLVTELEGQRIPMSYHKTYSALDLFE